MASTGHRTGKQTGEPTAAQVVFGVTLSSFSLTRTLCYLLARSKPQPTTGFQVLKVINLEQINRKEDSERWPPHPTHTDHTLQSHLIIKAISAQALLPEAVLNFRWNPNKWDLKLWRVRTLGLPCHFLLKPTFQSPALLRDLCASGFYCHSLISLLHYRARQVWLPEQSWNTPK